jgi:tRNA A-37 threonylcarbamoyl transferase component Bud32
MSPESHKRARQLFEEALERPEAERRLFLKVACGGDTSLFDAVDRLLAAHDSSSAFLEPASLPTKRIGRYEIRGELGRGAMGVVYEAVDPLIGRTVAVKVIHLEAFSDPREAEFLTERLFREARSAGQLFHPGIVVILDVGKEGDTAFIAMERVEGMSLQQTLALGRLSVVEAMAILRQTAAALDYAHDHGVVHRDIKPGNIMLHHGAMVKVADFGIAKVMSPQATMTGVVMGTPSYMSPEQIQAQAVDGRADQFSLAVLAFELLTGRRPFQGDSLPTLTHTIVFGERPSAHAANPAVPAGADDVLRRGLAKLPDERYSSCAEFIAALEGALKAPPPAPPTLIQPAPPAVVWTVPPPAIRESHVVAGLQVVAQDHAAVERHAAVEPEAKKPTTNWALALAVGAAVVVAAAIVAGFLYYRNIESRPNPVASTTGPVGKEGTGNPGPTIPPTVQPTGQPAVQMAVQRFAADPPSINAGASATLSWEVTGAQEIVIDNGIGKVEGIGGLGVTPAATTTYVLTATGPGGSARATVTIEVKSKPAGVPSTPPKPTPVTSTPPKPTPVTSTPPPTPSSNPQRVSAARARQLYDAAMEKRKGGLPGALDLLRQSAIGGEPLAMLQLGEDYRDGQEVTKDEKEAARWFRMAALSGNTSGMVFLGAMYSMGEGVEKSDQEAARWFEKAANAGNSAGLYNLAGMYERGQGVPYSLDKAKELYRKSAALGNAEAQKRLTQLGK